MASAAVCSSGTCKTYDLYTLDVLRLHHLQTGVHHTPLSALPDLQNCGGQQVAWVEEGLLLLLQRQPPPILHLLRPYNAPGDLPLSHLG